MFRFVLIYRLAALIYEAISILDVFIKMNFFNIELCISGHQDGDETGKDCGGSCESCGTNRYHIINQNSLTST